MRKIFFPTENFAPMRLLNYGTQNAKLRQHSFSLNVLKSFVCQKPRKFTMLICSSSIGACKDQDFYYFLACCSKQHLLSLRKNYYLEQEEAAN